MAESAVLEVGHGQDVAGKISFNLAGLTRMYDFTGKTVVLTGGAGVLGSAMASALAGCGAEVAILDIDPKAGRAEADRMGPHGKRVSAFQCDVLNKQSIEITVRQVIDRFGKLDCLINAAGGNKSQATTRDDLKFFDLRADALRWVFELNVLGTILPCQVFGKVMAAQGYGTILNISSMNAFRPLTRIPAYSAAKAAVSNFTEWLAVHMAQEYSAKIRVNAVAPGFFLTSQNRFLLTDKESGELTARGKAIIAHTPMARFGEPQDLFGAVLWLLSPASEFVTGVVVPVDGGFAAYSGV
jgi:NAD(P)-dependent dehydrogenase (short-subunit alcohol dehydrogenase family)